MRLIDADTLIEKCGDWYVEEGPEEGFIGTIKQLLESQPIVHVSDKDTDTISRQAAIEDVGDGVYTGSKIRRWLKSLPSVQPDVIRCKDCKYYKYGICMKIGANKSFHGFCDWAERREDG